ncbi:zincin-like metallopeptidase domain-containing protein [Polycladidibacter hongkongensis]|uniref:zincin-like metallopeptidase domain-containing protein n=1 Tax=Polycladidibacter hongkongensis TaxID=1647556 RepID=UPI00082EFD4D|nr:zincin-like metallopeptidase domain-containing protein [Pseudovibrio hongkongensis]
MSSAVPQKQTYRDDVARSFIKAIEEGTAPWQKPWEAGTYSALPFNPVSGKRYRGMNLLLLEEKGFVDPRWLTFKQGKEMGGTVRKGEKGMPIEYWKWSHEQTRTDDNGNPLRDDNGKILKERVPLVRPSVFYAHVFNASQFDGLEAYEPQAPGFDPLKEAESLLVSGAVPLFHDQKDRAYYTPARDQIHLPPKAAFASAYAYYATALHELGHASGHKDRLAREGGPFGSPAYAKEELKAEIASYLLCRELGLAHNPGEHASYVESWLKALRDDKNFIFQAARDAETIAEWVRNPDRRAELEQQAQAKAQTKQQSKSVEQEAQSMDKKSQYARKMKATGPSRSRQSSSWSSAAPKRDPREEFRDFMIAHGASAQMALPEMDGKWHRVELAGERKKNASYMGFTDGVPNGIFHNFKGDQFRWVSTGVQLSREERAALQAEAAQKAQEREKERRELHNEVAKKSYGVWTNNKTWANGKNCQYLAAKQVQGFGVKLDQNGLMMVPLRDAGGHLWNLQFVGEEKVYFEGGRKAGLFHSIDPDKQLQKHKDGAGLDLFICEGYSTGASLYAASKCPTVVAFDSGNLLPVAKALREKFPQANIAIACDNDIGLEAKGKKNVGVEKATEAAAAIGALVVVPMFKQAEQSKQLSDWNDLHCSRGLPALQDALLQSLNSSRAQEKAKQQAPERSAQRERELTL